MSTNTNPIPKRLKEARIATGISQKKLGILAGIDEFSASARMNQYEVGKHIPDYSILKRIGKVLKCPVSYFYAEDDSLAEVIITYSNLNKSDKKKIFQVIKSLV